MTLEITVRALSRSKQGRRAYNDQVKHGYNPNYVNPQTRRILLRAIGVPGNTVAFEWQVIRRRDGKLFRKSDRLKEPRPTLNIGFNLPSTGNYDCQLIITLSNGKQRKSPVKSINLRDLLIVVIGDSAASGQGNPDSRGKLNTPGGSFKDFVSKFAVEHLTSLIAAGKIDPPEMDKEPRWLEKNAHRSSRSGHVLAAGRLENLDAGIVVTLLTFARSGAEIKHGLLGPRKDEKRGNNEASWKNKNGKIGQIEELRKTVGNRTIDALVLSIGGNDLGFADGVTDMVKGDSKWIIFKKDDKKARAKIKETVTNMLGFDLQSGELTKPGGHFDQLKLEIDKLNVNKVFLVGYPTGFFDNNAKDASGDFELKGCEVFQSAVDLDLTGADMRLFRDTAQSLNKTLGTVIGPRFGWDFVDVTTGFAGHGYCSKGGRFFVHCEESLENQGDIDGMLHPNANGHAIYAEQIHQALRRSLIIHGVAPRPAGVAQPATEEAPLGGVAPRPAGVAQPATEEAPLG